MIIALIIISLLFFCLAIFAKGKMDISGRDGFENPWWNKSKSWTNKYAYGFISNHRKGYFHWYYLGVYYPKYKERFPLSTTLLVAFTEGWHLLQLFCWNAIIIGFAILFTIVIVLHYGWQLNFINFIYSFILFKIFYAIIFNLSYKS